MKLATRFDYPPIPVRCFDWSCIDSDTFDAGWDGESYVSKCPLGRGETEEAAIIDFVRMLLEKHDIQADEFPAGAQAEETQNYLDSLHTHECQQCGKVLRDSCDCKRGRSFDWCSSNCRAAYDL